MTALVVGNATAGVYMPFSDLALVEYAQEAIKTIANASGLELVAPELPGWHWVSIVPQPPLCSSGRIFSRLTAFGYRMLALSQVHQYRPGESCAAPCRRPAR